MNTVTIYGAATSRYEYFKYNLEAFLEEQNIKVRIDEIKDVSKLIEDRIVSIPTLRVNNHVDIVFNEQQGINHFLNEAKNIIMNEFAPDKLLKILVPIDFSEASLNAYKYAIDMAKKVGGQIHLLNVYHPSPMVVEGVIIDDSKSKNDRKTALRKIALDFNQLKWNLDLSDAQTILVNPIFIEGFAGDEIIKLSSECDYVVMGLEGENEAVKKFLGSVSSKVSSKAKCPVILVPKNTSFDELNKIVFGHSSTSFDNENILKLVQLSRTFGAELQFVHIKDGSDFDTGEINAYMEHMYPEVPFSFEVIEAETIGFGLNNFAYDQKGDLLVVAKKDRKNFDKLFHRSRSKSTLSNAILPVMVMHKGDRICRCGDQCKKVIEDQCDH